MPEAIKKYIDIILVLCFIVALVGLAYFHTKSVNTAHEQGYIQGVLDTSNKLAETQKAEREYRDKEKDKLEKESKEALDAAENDADLARDAANRLQHELTTVRDLVSQYSPVDTTGKTTRQAVGVLGDLLQRHIDRNRELAKFADEAYTAGLTCEKQYDSLKVTYGKDNPSDIGSDK